LEKGQALPKCELFSINNLFSSTWSSDHNVVPLFWADGRLMSTVEKGTSDQKTEGIREFDLAEFTAD
jgi:hypothetical protein